MSVSIKLLKDPSSTRSLIYRVSGTNRLGLGGTDQSANDLYFEAEDPGVDFDMCFLDVIINLDDITLNLFQARLLIAWNVSEALNMLSITVASRTEYSDGFRLDIFGNRTVKRGLLEQCGLTYATKLCIAPVSVSPTSRSVSLLERLSFQP